MYSLRMSFCTVPESFARGTPRSSPTTMYIVVGEERGGGVDGHRGGDPVERDLPEELRQVIHRVDRHPDPAHFARGHRVIGVVAHLGREVERGGEPGLSRGEKIAEPPVGFPGGAEAGVLAHGPE